jgi:hypothetical protein
MSDTAVTQNSKPATTELTDAQYKEMCKVIRQHQLKKPRSKKAKAVLRPIGKVTVIQRNITIEETPTDWDSIQDEVFSLDINATQLFVKTGKERARNLRTGKSLPVGGASVHKVFL